MRIISYNIENGAADSGVSVDTFANTLYPYNSDIILFQETWYRDDTRNIDMQFNTAGEIAKKLNMYFTQAETPYGVGIASKTPFVKIYDINKVSGAIIQHNAQLYNIFNVHMNFSPCQHYGLRGYPYPDLKPPETILDAVTLSWDDRKQDLFDIFDIMDTTERLLPCIIGGDFNEPSHLDWIKGHEDIPDRVLPCPWMASRYLYARGFLDAARVVYSDPLLFPLYTNSVIRRYYPADPPERIDFIYYKNLPFTRVNYDSPMWNYSDHLPIIVDFN